MSPRDSKSSSREPVSPTSSDRVLQTPSKKQSKHSSVVYTDEEEQPTNETEEQILKERDIWEQEEYDEFFPLAGIPGMSTTSAGLTSKVL